MNEKAKETGTWTRTVESVGIGAAPDAANYAKAWAPAQQGAGLMGAGVQQKLAVERTFDERINKVEPLRSRLERRLHESYRTTQRLETAIALLNTNPELERLYELVERYYSLLFGCQN